MSKTSTPRFQRGITLVEAMSTLAIVSIALGSALPHFGSLRQRAALSGAAAQIETDVQFARSQAVALNRTVHLSLREVAGRTCYMVHTGAAADCSCGEAGQGEARCGGGAELLRSVTLNANEDVQLRSATRSLTFDPVKGTVTPTATLRVEARDGRAIHQVVNLLGRVRSCTPRGGVPGERAC